MRCPICKKPSAPQFRPFCSERCQTRDLANWAAGAYAVASESLSSDDPEITDPLPPEQAKH